MRASKRTGIFFTYFQGQRLRDFPEALAGILDKENVFYYDAVYESIRGPYYVKPVTMELLLKVHSRGMVEQVKRTGYYRAASYSAGGTVHDPLTLPPEQVKDVRVDMTIIGGEIVWEA